MQVVHERCAGIDVHKKSITVCRIVPNETGDWQREVRTFGTMTADLLKAADWLAAVGVTQVAMEPVLVAVGVDKKAFTHELILAGRSFTVNLWSREDTRPFVKFSKPAVKDGMTLNGRAVREGVTGAPVFEAAIAYLDCRLWETVDCGTHTLMIGEVADCGLQGEGDELVARMDDTRMKYGGVRRGGH